MKGLNLALIFGTAIGLICEIKPVFSFNLSFIRDDEFAVDVTLFQGNVDDEGNLIPPSAIEFPSDFSLVGNWWTIQGTITGEKVLTTPVQFNSVSINGSIFHNRPTSDGQDGNGSGAPFNFNLMIQKTRPSLSIIATQKSGLLSHGEHFDTYVATLSAFSTLPTTNFPGYELRIRGKHSPEPSSLITLLALGTIGAGATLKRKLKR